MIEDDFKAYLVCLNLAYLPYCNRIGNVDTDLLSSHYIEDYKEYNAEI